ncbi:MAG TPA: hypothetical protein VM052_03435 [Candidatus Limnocylindrales bacterium]|nr:hypothetical protein [Candidatus Limnocylindrales bacterium]
MVGKRAALAVLLSAVVACGGTPKTSSTSPAASGAATQAAASGSGAGSANTGGQPKLADLLAAGKLTSYKVTYRITATGGAAGMSGEQSWYFKPPRSRFDFSSNAGGQTSTISVYSLPEGSYYCFAGGGQSQCLSVAGVGSPLDANMAAMAQQSLMGHPDQYGATFKESRSIAGQQGFCYDVTGNATGVFSAGLFCYDKNGLALLSSFTVQGASWSTEATNVSLNVPDSDFTLPAKPLGK